MTMTEHREIRRLALRFCYESGLFDTAREVDANPNHPIVRDAWERAKRAIVDGEEVRRGHAEDR